MVAAKVSTKQMRMTGKQYALSWNEYNKRVSLKAAEATAGGTQATAIPKPHHMKGAKTHANLAPFPPPSPSFNVRKGNDLNDVCGAGGNRSHGARAV